MQSFTKSTLPTAVTMPRSRRHRSSTERSRSRTRDRDRDRRRRRLEDSQSYSSKHRSRSSRTRGSETVLSVGRDFALRSTTWTALVDFAKFCPLRLYYPYS
ncbi:probable RNA-binding protein 23 isoform X3 [Cherax quadricarinatus]|uniref:probable RNA-binding protein 23 isoform X3 n=1 Tax=Cherax quadricarinatus TaxID=27406 RepID=UPI00387EA1FC